MSIIIFLYGLLLGSFYNVVGLRVPMKQSIVRPRSACPGCGRTLSYVELIPVVSYLLQLGRCKQCRTRISPIYPIMELATALLFVFAYRQIGWTFELVIALTLISLCIIVFVSDVAYMIIPNRILLFFTGLFIIERVIHPLTPWWDSIIGALVAFLLLLLIAMVSKGGMGGGDIKLFALIGFIVGLKSFLLSFFFATFFGAVVGLVFISLKIIERKKPIPFGPFIVLGTLITYFYHEPILSWYLSLL